MISADFWGYTATLSQLNPSYFPKLILRMMKLDWIWKT